jgi:FMN phosphatase YigB (HAD superfamily)
MKIAISLDFWGTIALHNPDYRAEVTRYFAKILSVSDHEGEARYKLVKDACDLEAEMRGTAVTPHEAVKRLAGNTDICVDSTVAEIERLVRKHPPRLHPDFPKVLSDLQNQGCIIGVSSNTNFISGSTIQSVFRLPWDFEVYSDEIGASKPDRKFFKHLLWEIGAIKGWNLMEGIYHIGDNQICDGGATKVDLEFLLVNSPNDTITHLKSLIGKKSYATC